MPTISVEKMQIEKLLGKEFKVEEFNDLLFDFGLEIDDYEEDKMIYKIEIPANRYDLLCTQGLSLALKSYLFNEQFEDIKIKESDYKIIQQETNIRKCVAAAVIRGYNFDSSSFNDFISLQEKLSGSIGRNRSIVAIGTHDLSKFEWPVIYKSVRKGDLNFIPLRHSQLVNGNDLEKVLSTDNHLAKYFSLVENDSFNVFVDPKGKILSVPPIINSEDTKITLDTKDIMVEVTGTNFHRVNTALKMILNSFRTDEIYSVSIEEIKTPVNEEKEFVLELAEIEKEINININLSELIYLLTKMMYRCTKLDDSTLKVHVPNARQDIIHKVDVLEDVAVAYGFNNLKRELPNINTIGKEDSLNKFTDKVRIEMALSGFVEVYTLALISKTENLFDSSYGIEVNSSSLECEVGRTSLLPSLLKSVASNLHTKIPMKIFESGDVIHINRSHEIGAENKRMLAALLVNNTPQLEEIQGPLTLLLRKIGLNPQFVRKDIEERYLKNQSAIILIDGEEYGSIGVVNPDVLKVFKIPYPGSSFEINLDKLFSRYMKID